MTQPTSALRGLKRSWSGSASDLHDPISTGGGSSSKSVLVDSKVNKALLPSSSPEVPIPWSPSPSPLEAQKRRNIESSHMDESETPTKRSLPNGFGRDENHRTSTPASTKQQQGASFLEKTAHDLKRQGKFGLPGRTISKSFSSITPEPPQSRRPAPVFLSKEQSRVKEMVVNEGKNVFFTGSAGTGKSVLLREIIAQLRNKFAHKQDAIAVTASTGIAACNIGGVTLHSYAGAGLGTDPVDALCSKIRKNRKSMGRWMRTAVLIIDEVSMVEPDFLDKLEAVARKIRKSSKRFGGIQLVLTGDFFQLPPVSKNGNTRFAFESDCWDSVIDDKVSLTQVFRQRDTSFVTMLNEMRLGRLSQESINRFRSLSRTPDLSHGMVPTELFPLRNEVDRANAQRLNAIKGPVKCYDSTDAGTLPDDMRQRVLSNFMAPPKLVLKAGAQVMLIKNTDEMLVNGSVGTILAFLGAREYRDAVNAGMDWDRITPSLPVSRVEEIIREGTRGAVSFAKGKNMLKREAEEGLVDDFEMPIPPKPSGAMNTRVRRSVSPDKVTKESPKFPVVRFVLPSGGTRVEHILPEVWKNELPNGEIQASRTQIPLILAWAMSIHKSQGQTLPCCKIDLGRVFEKGQAYVALSRATALEGLQVFNFHASKVMAHPRVIEWTKTLGTKS